MIPVPGTGIWKAYTFLRTWLGTIEKYKVSLYLPQRPVHNTFFTRI